MKDIALSDGKVAKCSVSYGHETPKLARPALKPGQKAHTTGHKSVRMHITVTKDGKEIAQYEGKSYRSPADQWDRVEGRKRAMRRMFDQDTEQAEEKAAASTSESLGPFTRNQVEPFKVLSTKDRKELAQHLLLGLPKDEEEASEETQAT